MRVIRPYRRISLHIRCRIIFKTCSLLVLGALLNFSQERNRNINNLSTYFQITLRYDHHKQNRDSGELPRITPTFCVTSPLKAITTVISFKKTRNLGKGLGKMSEKRCVTLLVWRQPARMLCVELVSCVTRVSRRVRRLTGGRADGSDPRPGSGSLPLPKSSSSIRNVVRVAVTAAFIIVRVST